LTETIVNPSQAEELPNIQRDGSSQAGRSQAALDPNYVLVDERSLKDLLNFAKAYAKELRYFEVVNEQVQATGDWSKFLDELDPEEVLKFIQNPERFPPEKAKPYTRPHVVLFLTFLQLLQHTRNQLNTFTQRHLDFYYQEVLQATKKPGNPDKVNVLLELAPNSEPTHVPVGTRLNAGTDSLGQDRFYRTDNDIVVSHAQVAQLSSVYVEKRITGIREARENHANNKNEAIMQMLQMALGDPLPGDPLPLYKPEKRVNYECLSSLKNFVNFIQPGLSENLSDFRRLMKFKRQHDNDFLKAQKIASPLEYPCDGEANIEDLDTFYTEFLEVEKYFCTTAEKFTSLMNVVEKWVSNNEEPTSEEWNEVYKILEEAHKTKVYADRREKLKQVREDESFEAMLDFAVGNKQKQSELTSLGILTEYIQNDKDDKFLKKINQTLLDGGSVADNDWDNIYRIVELVQRILLDEPIAQKVEWLNLYPTEDASMVNVDIGIEDDKKMPRWKTFGQAPPEEVTQEKSLLPTTFGWAVTSPLLALSEGKRTIILTLGFRSDKFDRNKIESLLNSTSPEEKPFYIEISTEKGWIKADAIACVGNYESLSGLPKSGDEETLSAIQFTLILAENIDALAPPSTQLDSRWPILRLMLRQIWEQSEQEKTGKYINHYQHFKELILLKTHIKVMVSGLTPSHLQNDETQLSPNKSFEPFGSQPVAGARFYLGHPELITKKLDCFDFKLEWMGVPDHLESRKNSDKERNLNDEKAYYKNYPDSGKISNEGFTVRIKLIDKLRDISLNEKAHLFIEEDVEQGTAAQPNEEKRTSAFRTISIEKNTLKDKNIERNIEAITDTDLLHWNRYWQWELNTPDFQHQNYPTVAASKAQELAIALSEENGDVTAANYQVNPPYTPKIKSLKLDYNAAVEIVMADYKPGSQTDRIFYIQPFGFSEIMPEQPFFLPQYNYEGELYIGIRDVHPPQNLSLLFQMAEGSANPDLEPVPVQWHYLSGNRWISLENGNVLQDTTRGLIHSGIISLSLESSKPSTLFPGNLYWIRAAIPQHSSSVCDTVAIHTQAVAATFIEQNNAPDHLSRSLPANSISDLAEPLPQIKGVRQPYTSYGGKMAEQNDAFYRRLSERLRHKQRAITIWDYEHLILERFPEIYKAKCLPATPDKPGQVEIIVIPDIRNQRPFNPFEPKASVDLITNIKTYIADTILGFATVKVRNAHYVAVKVRFAVRFLSGYNEGYYKQQLSQAITHFLSPWAYEEGVDIVIGGRIYANVIINFIEEQPYVDYAAKIKLFSSQDGKTFQLARSSSSESYWVGAEQPDVILVAARQHEIDIISDAGYEEEDFEGINYMKVELDFIVG
jgi:hypothetical protein